MVLITYTNKNYLAGRLFTDS